jgi:predicted transcriptional regulator
MPSSPGRSTRPASRRDAAPAPIEHNLDLVDYLDELADVRVEAQENLAAAGERALKVLDRFLGNLAHALGMAADRVSMGDAIFFLNRIPGVPRDIATQAERYRETRNAVAHLPDVMLRPEAAQRIIAAVESLVRMAAQDVRDLSRRAVVTARANEPAAEARDRMLDHGYNQLVVVNEHGGAIDVLTDRDIVLLEAEADIDDAGAITVGAAVARRGRPAAVFLSVRAAADEAVAALRDELIAAVVLTDSGRPGQPPRGIITRRDILKSL